MGQIWPGHFYAAGSIRVSAAGDPDGVPAFSGISLATPTDIALIPSLSHSNTTPMVLSRTTDFVLSWTPTTGAGNVDIEIDSGEPYLSVIIKCAAAASAGTFAVPKELLAKLKDASVNSPSGQGAIHVKPRTASVFSAGNFTIELTAEATELKQLNEDWPIT